MILVITHAFTYYFFSGLYRAPEYYITTTIIVAIKPSNTNIIMMKYLILAFLWSSLAFLVQGQRTPTISYISASMRTKQGGTIEMDCSTLYATEYPILWVKLPKGDCSDRKNYDLRSQDADPCTPVPLSSGSALIVRDNRFRYNK